jgi:hypothetical protein
MSGGLGVGVIVSMIINCATVAIAVSLDDRLRGLDFVTRDEPALASLRRTEGSGGHTDENSWIIPKPRGLVNEHDLA